MTGKYLREPIAAVVVYALLANWALLTLSQTASAPRGIVLSAVVGAALFTAGTATSSFLSEKSRYVVVTSLEGTRALRNWNRECARNLGLSVWPPLRRYIGTRRTPPAADPAETTALRCERIAQPRATSVLLVTIDALRSDYYGVPEDQLPNFARLRAQSLEFPHALSATSGTMGTLFALDTGRYTTAKTPTLSAVKVLGVDLGMETEQVAQEFTQPASEFTDFVLERLEDWKTRGQPFFFHPHYLAIHLPKRLLRVEHDYARAVKEVDAELGRLLDYIEGEESLDDLLLIVSADHGEELAAERGYVSHGYGVTTTLLDVPLFFRAPSVAPERSNKRISLVDVFPTALDLLAIRCNYTIHGRSVLAGQPPHRVLFSSSMAPNPVFDKTMRPLLYSDLHAAVKYPWKVVVNRGENAVALYDLRRDPDERQNLADGEPERLAEMLDHIDRYLEGDLPEFAASGSN